MRLCEWQLIRVDRFLDLVCLLFGSVLGCSLATLTYLSQKPGNIVSAVDSLLKSSNTGEEEQRDIATLGESACAL
jgi:hypothetical protein